MAERHESEKKEIDANDMIRDYEEQADVSEPEEAQTNLPWYEQAKQDTAEPPEAALAGGDIDAAWDQAAVGDETVSGSSPTPDQDIVEELSEALGVTYQDDEPLRPEEKLARRDDERWELHPASSEDFSRRNAKLQQPIDEDDGSSSGEDPWGSQAA